MSNSLKTFVDFKGGALTAYIDIDVLDGAIVITPDDLNDGTWTVEFHPIDLLPALKDGDSQG